MARGRRILSAPYAVALGTKRDYARSGDLYLGYNTGSRGTYDLQSGSLLMGNAYIGENGQGTFLQEGGDVTVDTSRSLYIGDKAGSTGSYTLQSGSLSLSGQYAPEAFIGYAGGGTFTQNGGTVTLTRADPNYAEELDLAEEAGSNGTYHMTDGSLDVQGELRVANKGTGLFDQQGGIVNVDTLRLSYGGPGTYKLGAGTLTVSGNAYLYGTTTDNYQQTGGTAHLGTIQGGKYIHLDGGKLYANTENLLGLNQTDGSNIVSSDLNLGTLGDTGTNYEISGGSISTKNLSTATDATFKQTGGTVDVTATALVSGWNEPTASSYQLDAGSFSTDTLDVSSGRATNPADFVQNGGDLTANTLIVANHVSEDQGTYENHGGTATLTTVTLGGQVGYERSANVVVDQGGVINSQTVNLSVTNGIGSFDDGHVTIAGTGSKWLISDGLTIGNPGSTQTSLSGFTVQNGGLLSVGQTLNLRRGTLTINGGQVTTNQVQLNKAQISLDAQGTFQIGTGSIQPDANGYHAFIGSGTLQIPQGSQLQIANASRLTPANGDTWNLNIAGQLVENGDLTVADQGTASLTIGSPTAVADSHSAFIARQTDSNGSVTLNQAGVWNVNGSLFVGGSASSAGGQGTLAVQDSASLTVSQSIKLWDHGTLAFGGGSITTTDLQTAGGTFNWTGGDLTLNSDQTLSSTGSLGSSLSLGSGMGLSVDGTLTIAPGASLIVDGGNFSATSVVNHGTFRFLSGTIGGSQDLIIQNGSLLGGNVSWGQNVNLQLGGGLVVGDTTNGTLAMTKGVTVESGTGVLGRSAGGNGTIGVSGQNSLWTVDHALTVGPVGTGTLNVSDGAKLTAASASIGGTAIAQGGHGTVTIGAGGTMAVAGSVKVWSSGQLTINGGSLAVGSLDANPGNFDWGSGSFDVTKGDLIIGTGGPVGNVTLGSGQGDRTELSVSGQTSIVAGAQLTVNGGAFSTGTLTDNGSVAFDAGSFTLKHDSLTIGSAGIFGDSFTIDGSRHLTVGHRLAVAAGGKFTVTGQAMVHSGSASIDGTATSEAIATLNSPDATWRISGGFDVGAAGQARLLVDSGQLSAGTMNVGVQKTSDGAVEQTGGDASIAGTLSVGVQAGSDASYHLAGGQLTLSDLNNAAFIGAAGTGHFTQSGGTLQATRQIISKVILGNQAGATGTYTLTHGTLYASKLFVGNEGTGQFTQHGGTLKVVTADGQSGVLDLGASPGGNGSYTIDGGQLIGPTIIYVGPQGTGQFIQHGGTVNPQTILTVLGGGQYAVDGGSFESGQLGIWDGIVRQSGGTVAVNGADQSQGLFVGSTPGNTEPGRYDLSSGSVSTNYLVVGASMENNGNPYPGYGVFTQTGGTVTTDTLKVLGEGRYQLNGGDLQATSVGVSGDGTGATLNLANGQTLQSNTGNITGNVGAPGTVTLSSASNWNIASNLYIAGSPSQYADADTGVGILNIHSGSAVTVGNEIVIGKGGTVNISPNASLTFSQIEDRGVINTPGLTLDGTTLSGRGTIVGQTINNGNVSPGESSTAASSASAAQAMDAALAVTQATSTPDQSLGTLTIHGDYTQKASGTFLVQITDPALVAKKQYTQENDMLAVSGTANLAGTLNISMLAGYQPTLGETFTIMSYQNHIGTFSDVVTQSLSNGLQFKVLYNSQNIQLITQQATPEPGTLGLLLVGAFGLLRMRRTRGCRA